jgi:hypothetical protein
MGMEGKPGKIHEIQDGSGMHGIGIEKKRGEEKNSWAPGGAGNDLRCLEKIQKPNTEAALEGRMDLDPGRSP